MFRLNWKYSWIATTSIHCLNALTHSKCGIIFQIFLYRILVKVSAFISVSFAFPCFRCFLSLWWVMFFYTIKHVRMFMCLWPQTLWLATFFIHFPTWTQLTGFTNCSTFGLCFFQNWQNWGMCAGYSLLFNCSFLFCHFQMYHELFLM